MAYKPNYNQQRAERDRAKRAKKDEKLRKLQEQAERRKAERPGDDPDAAADDVPSDAPET